ncbi:MAG: SBBP repeat-containing protein, partial [Promethearchaeota archaeon]
MRKHLCILTVLLVMSFFPQVLFSAQMDTMTTIENRNEMETQFVNEVLLSQATGGVLFSSYLGSNHSDTAVEVTLDSLGFIYVVGITNSTDFPSTHQIGTGGRYDCFVLKLAPNGADLIYSTVIGGSGSDYAVDIAVDEIG